MEATENERDRQKENTDRLSVADWSRTNRPSPRLLERHLSA